MGDRTELLVAWLRCFDNEESDQRMAARCADEIERLTTENRALRETLQRRGKSVLPEVARLTAEVTDLKELRDKIFFECKFVSPRIDEIRRLVGVTASGSLPPHGAAITMDDDGKFRTILDDADDSKQQHHPDHEPENVMCACPSCIDEGWEEVELPEHLKDPKYVLERGREILKEIESTDQRQEGGDG